MVRVGYILRSYPRLSQTFILNEILALERLGLDLQIFAITDPHEPVVQAQVAEVRAPVAYLEAATQRGWPAILAEHLSTALAAPRRYFQTLSYVLRRADLDAGYSAGSRLQCFAQAVYLARQIARAQQAGHPVGHLHAHFAHDPTLIALLTHMLTGVPFSFTGHARDLYQIPRPILAERIAAARAVVTCCRPNLGYLQEVAPEQAGAKVRLIHHGVDLEGFRPAAHARVAAELPLILSVGRLVEKKGFPDLLRACSLLKHRGYRFRCLIYGDGPLRAELAGMIAQLGLPEVVHLAGACAQRELVPVFQRADIFALAPFVTDDGDRDGVPNVLVEAMACGVPVVSTAVAGIPDLVEHGHNGLLVAPHDGDALAGALAALLDDAAWRARLGAAARRTVVEHFDLRSAAQQLAVLFGQPLDPDPSVYQRDTRARRGQESAAPAP
jgi:glycosyltransferase involved in cell wall biosynthesis